MDTAPHVGTASPVGIASPSHAGAVRRRSRGDRRLPALVAALLLTVAACASDDDRVDPVPPPATDDDPDATPDDPPDPGEPTDDPPADPPDDEDDDGDASGPEDGPNLDVEVALTEVARLASAIAGATGPDGTLYLADRSGTVHPLDEGGVGEPVVDLSEQVTTDGERGLLGIAFTDDGSELYLSFTDLDGGTVLAAVPVEDGEVQPGDPRVLFTLDQPFANHNGGDVAVGPDGYLYLGLGDGGGSGDPLEAGQDLTTPLGSMLRIDPAGGDPYAVPGDNPFLDDADAVDEIVAYGLRNPWRFSFDRDTGELWIADVGQSDREEINVLALDEVVGANLGWNLMEGTEPFAGSEPDDHLPPVFEYEHGPGCSVTGGYVYRGAAIGELVGAYLYTDLCDGTLRAIVVRDGEVVDEGELGVSATEPVSFAEDGDGELYLLQLDGVVSRIDPA